MDKVIVNEPVFDIRLVREDLTEEAIAIMNSLKEKVCYISEFKSIKRYDEAIRTFATNLTYGFEHKEFRDCPVQFKFNRDDEEEEVKWLPYRHFVINLIMWRPQMCLDSANMRDGNNLIIQSSEMVKIGPKLIKEYFDANYVRKYNRFIPEYPNLRIEDINGTLSEILGETTFLIQKTTSMFSKFFGLSADIETFMDLAKRNPEIDALMHFKLDEMKQPSEMEQDLSNAISTFVDCVLKDGEFNKLKPLLASKSGLKLDQVRDMVINSGLKPNFDGRTIPRPINTNFLAGGGFRDLTDWYTNAISGRKAAILNNEFMGKTGHMLILVAIATASVRLSKTCLDCDTVNPIPIEIKTKTHLQKMDGRRYRYRGEKAYRILDARTDTNLIGETVEFRSPITCACKDGVCRECYGELYYTNIDNVVTGIYSATTVMNPVVQGILSAKHHQTTNTRPIVFNEGFNRFFSLASTDIVLDLDADLDPSEYSLVILTGDIARTDGEELDLDLAKKTRRRKKNVDSDNDSDGDSDDFGGDEDDGEMSLESSMKYYVTRFMVARNLHDKTKETEFITFQDKDSKELFIHNDFILKMSKDVDSEGNDIAYLDFEDINPDEFIFLVDVENNELTRPMKAIQRIINNKDHEGCNTYQEVTNKMLDLIIASKLDAMNIHAEMIIRELIRRKSNILKRPDFSKIIMSKDYELMTINSALRRNPSITTSLSTPYLKHQLVNLTETFVKEAQSVFDPFFKPTLVQGDGCTFK